MHTLWAERFAQRTQRMKSSAVRELLKLTELPEVISFAGGLPAPETFPVEHFTESFGKVMADFGAKALQYSTTEGYRPLRELIAERATRYGIRVEADNILITSGSQQALDLIGKVFINPGDHILVESPTYLGALQAWNAYQAEYVAAATDHDGYIVESVEQKLRTGPKFIYALPNFQNPSGVTMSLERRHRLIEIADHYGAPILEDDPYGQLRYEGEHVPSLVTLDSQFRSTNGAQYSGNVIYLSTFSKTLSPGIRLGWIVAPVEVIRKLVQAKQGTDLHTSTVNQMVAYEASRGGFLDQHVKMIRAVYRERRDTMLAALAQHFPKGISWTRPQGGLFLWLTFPEWMDAGKVLKAAVEQKVAFVPGTSFFADGTGHNTARLNFSNATPERIEEGVKRLARCLETLIESHQPKDAH
ncbi:MAG: PLP-dependent aminotransferase family protein [Acidobacteria bacterium]|nr:PLP-dependent aminotransferase family protein [Acidobacteriota bacterium]